MPFMKWEKTSDGYKPVGITDEEMVAENARRRGKRAEVWLDEANEMVKREKEKKMEFDKSRVFTSLNADELKPGDKVIVADSLGFLRQQVEKGAYIEPLREVLDENYLQRFKTPSGAKWGLAYLVERAENCTNCVENGRIEGCTPMDDDKLTRCWNYKPKESCTNCANSGNSYCVRFTRDKSDDELSRTVCDNYIRLGEQKAEMPELISLGNGQYAERKHYRPFKDTDELIEKWWNLQGWSKEEAMYKNKLKMPLIWVRCKASGNSYLITGYFTNDNEVCFSASGFSMNDLLKDYEFLDGSVCGVEE